MTTGSRRATAAKPCRSCWKRASSSTSARRTGKRTTSRPDLVMKGAAANILETIGRTPIVKLQKVARHVAADIFVKCEYLNPAGSMKDRVALNIITDAERRGL